MHCVFFLFALVCSATAAPLLVVDNNADVSYPSNATALAFGPSWVIWSEKYSNISSLINVRLPNFTSNVFVWTLAQQIKIGGAEIPSITDCIMVRSKQVRSVKLFKIENMSIVNEYNITTSPINPLAISNYNIIFIGQQNIIKSSNNFSSGLYRSLSNSSLVALTITTEFVVNNFFIVDYYDPNNVSVGYIYISPVSVQLILLNSSLYSNYSQCTYSHFNPYTLHYMKVCPTLIQIWDFNNKIIYATLGATELQNSNNTYASAVSCKYFDNFTLFIILSQQFIHFYTVDFLLNYTYSLNSLTNPPVSVTSQLKCLGDGSVGFQGFNQIGYRTVYYLYFSIINNLIANLSQTNISNSSNSFNLSTSSAISTNVTSATAMSQLFNLQQGKKFLIILANTASITSSIPYIRQILKPISFLVQELWFYGTHKIQYTTFSQMFMQESNIFNIIRVKPQFLNHLNIQIGQNKILNSLYFQASESHKRAPKQQFMFLSVQDIYTFNLFQTITIIMASYFFCIFCKWLYKIWPSKLLKSIASSLNYYYEIWFILLIYIENNLANMCFYGIFQFRIFFFYDLFSKINLIFTTFSYFAMLFYSFFYYSFIFHYIQKSKSKHVLTIGIFLLHGFELQAIFNCHRRMWAAFIHAFFTNSHFYQLCFLIVLDAFIIWTLIKLRVFFKSKVKMLLLLLYFIGFLAFDLGIIIATQFIYYQNLQAYLSSDIFIYFQLIVILILCTVTFLKIGYELITVFIKIFKQVFVISRISDKARVKMLARKQKELGRNSKLIEAGFDSPRLQEIKKKQFISKSNICNINNINNKQKIQQIKQKAFPARPLKFKIKNLLKSRQLLKIRIK